MTVPSVSSSTRSQSIDPTIAIASTTPDVGAPRRALSQDLGI